MIRGNGGVAGSGPSVAAVVVSHDSVGDLPACLEALVTAEGVDQVVVVDNASSDASVEVARAARGSRVEVLTLEENTGYAGGCNRGLEVVRPDADVVAVLNPDVVVSEDCLVRCAAAIRADGGVGAVAPRLMRPDGVTVDSVGQVLRRWSLEVRDRGYGHPLDGRALQPRDVLAACGALAVYRRAALDAVADERGPWAGHYFCFWEDLELGWRLVNNGWRVRTVPDAVATHRRGAGARAGGGPLRWRRPAELEACVLTNRWMTLARHLHGLDLTLRLPLLLVRDLAAVTVGAMRRPRLLGHLRRRWPLVVGEWRERGGRPRRRWVDLPC